VYFFSYSVVILLLGGFFGGGGLIKRELFLLNPHSFFYSYPVFFLTLWEQFLEYVA
jgi:hypothetical protein